MRIIFGAALFAIAHSIDCRVTGTTGKDSSNFDLVNATACTGGNDTCWIAKAGVASVLYYGGCCDSTATSTSADACSTHKSWALALNAVTWDSQTAGSAYTNAGATTSITAHQCLSLGSGIAPRAGAAFPGSPAGTPCSPGTGAEALDQCFCYKVGTEYTAGCCISDPTDATNTKSCATMKANAKAANSTTWYQGGVQGGNITTAICETAMPADGSSGPTLNYTLTIVVAVLALLLH